MFLLKNTFGVDLPWLSHYFTPVTVVSGCSVGLGVEGRWAGAVPLEGRLFSISCDYFARGKGIRIEERGKGDLKFAHVFSGETTPEGNMP